MPVETVEQATQRALVDHRRAKVAYQDEIAQMDECFDFYHGEGIWSRPDKAKLVREKRPALEINLVKPVINLILGIERDTQQMMRVYAEHSEDVMLAAALDSIGNRVWYDLQGSDLRAEMFGSGVIANRGHVMLYPDTRNGNTTIKAIEIDPRECFPDPDSRTYDPDKDGNHFSLERWFAPSDLESMYPDDIEQIRSLHEAMKSTRPMGTYGSATHRRLPGEDYVKDPRLHYDLTRDRLEVIELYRRRAANVYRLTDPHTGYYEDFKNRSEAEGAHLEAAKTIPAIGRRMYIERISTTKMDRIVIIGGKIVPKGQWGEQPGPDEMGWRLITFRAHHFGGKTSGVVKDLIDPTRQYNKTYSNLLHILTSVANSGWMVPMQSMIPEKFFQEHGSETGLEVRYRAPFEPKKIMPQPPATGHLVDMDTGVAMVDRIAGVPDALRGVAPANVESGYGVARLQNYGLAVLGVLYGNLLRTERTFYNKMLMMAMHFLPIPDEIEILGQKLTSRLEKIAPEEAFVSAGDQRFLRLGALGGLNRLKNLKYKVRTERGPVLRTQREYWLQSALQIAQFVPPGSIPPELLVELTDHPDAQRIIENIAEQRELAMMAQGIQSGAAVAGQGAAQ